MLEKIRIETRGTKIRGYLYLAFGIDYDKYRAPRRVERLLVVANSPEQMGERLTCYGNVEITSNRKESADAEVMEMD